MNTYTTNKRIYENNQAGEYQTPTYNFPHANKFTSKQLYSLDNDYILFDCVYTLTSGCCPNCNHSSCSVKEYKYIYPVIGVLNGKVIIARIQKRSFRCKNSSCKCATFIQDSPQITKRHRYSSSVNCAIIDMFKQSISYKYIASVFHTSTTTILRLIDKLVIKRTCKAHTKNIMVDETRLLNRYSKKHGTFQFFIYDVDTNVLLDILEDRSSDNVTAYFQSFFQSASLTTLIKFTMGTL